MMSARKINLTMQDQHRRYNALKNYFTAGFSYKEICNFLFRFHRIKMYQGTFIPHVVRGDHGTENVIV